MGSFPELRLAWATHEAAKLACERWHYSHKMPAGKLVKVGVWEGGKFIGVVIFGRGANNNIGGRYRLEQTEICELVRIALREHVNPVSRIAALAIRLLRKHSPGVVMLVSYADPARGHHGGIYQAMNWVYVGRSTAQRELMVNGKPMHKRSATAQWGTASPVKLRTLTGKRVEYGPIEWKHTYLMPLTEGAKGTALKMAKAYPRPKQATAPVQGASGGAAPTRTLQP